VKPFYIDLKEKTYTMLYLLNLYLLRRDVCGAI